MIILNKKYIIENTPEKITNHTKNITIETITTPKEIHQFYTFPFKIYKNNPHWVPPFWKEIKEFFRTTNPFWTHAQTTLFLAKQKNEIVGRIAGIIDHSYIKHEKQNIGFFGFFECIHNQAVAHALFTQTENWLQTQQMTKIRGPIDGRADIGCGFLTHGHNTPTSLLSTYSPPYYPDLAEQNHLIKIRDLISYKIDITIPLPQSLSETIHYFKNEAITIEPFPRLYTTHQLNQWISLFLETFQDHWGYTPVTPDEIKTRFGIKQLRYILDPDLFLIAKKHGKPIAYIWATPDYNQIIKNMNGKMGAKQGILYLQKNRYINKGKHHLIGIKKNYRNKDIGYHLTTLTLHKMQQRGYKSTEIGWIDEQNTNVHKIIQKINGQLHRIYRVYEKNLQ